ncbi:MAG: hypothetical protein GY845_24565 [Planctomycetes bacterium]|nr:hypothetical protein [Planctomycetota bacterium]
MKIKNKFQYITTPARVFMTVFIVLFAVSMLQGICIQIEQTYAAKKRFKDEEKSKAKLTDEEQRLDRIRSSTKEFMTDGTIHLINRLEHISDQKYQEQIYDTNDNLLWEGPSDKRPYEYLPWDKHLRRGSESFTKKQMKQTQIIRTDFSRNVSVPVRTGTKIEQIWRYHPGAGYFKGYNASSEQIGFAGAAGFTDSKSKVKPFGEFGLFTAWCPKDSFSPILLWQTQRRIYQINFEKQEVETIFESTEADIESERISLTAWRNLNPGEKGYIDPNKYRPLIQCNTRDGKHHLILREPEQQLSLNLRYASVIATKQEIYVRSFGSDSFPPEDIELYNKWLEERRGKTRNLWIKLFKVDNLGNLDLLNRYDWTAPPLTWPMTTARDPRPTVKRYVSQFSPPLYDFVVRLFSRKFLTSFYSYQNRGDFSYDLLQGLLEIRPYDGVINRIFSILMMVFVFWHGWPRRTTWARFIFWLVFVGLFNIAGLLTYLALNHTAVIKCPACGKRRGLAQVNCVRCRAQLPAPERGKLDLIFSA